VTPTANEHYVSDQIDPMFIAAARDWLYPHLVHGRILNVGLGYGTWDERLCRETGSKVIGLDISSELVEHHRAKYPQIEYSAVDVFGYRPPHAFDTIVASHLLEHIDDAIGLLRLFGQWLTPQGRLLVVVPNAHSVHRIIGRRMGLLRELTDLNEGDRMLGHVRVYTPALLRSHFQEATLQVREFSGVTFKSLSNRQLAAMPREYVEACCALSTEVGDLAGQLAVVASR